MSGPSRTPIAVASVEATKQIGNWIDGRHEFDASARHAPVYDPATGGATGQVALADAAVVDRAVASARLAFATWRDVPLSQRVPLLWNLHERVRARRDELIATVCAEHGKVPADAQGELQRALEGIELACAAPHLLKGEYTEQVSGGLDTYSFRQPLGVCAGITPFNFPAMVPLWMLPIALVTGNTFVLKPSERDPSVALLLAELAQEAGIPDGVFNVVQGDKTAVDALLDHPDVAAVSFVGSTPIARYVYTRGSAAGKRVQALGGAKNHMVVLADADLDRAADAATSAAFGSTGQRCMAISAVVADEAIAEDLVARIAERIGRLRVGAGTDPDAEMGPLVSGEARDRIVGAIERGVDAGAKLVCDGRVADSAAEGFFVGPTLFDDVSPEMDLYTEELFGPVLIVVRVDGLDEALRLIDDNPYGNGSAVFTRSGGAARRFQREVSAGMVGVNVSIPVPVSYHSFGGWKASLFGDQHLQGAEGFRFFTRAKVVTSRWPQDEAHGIDLSFPSQ